MTLSQIKSAAKSLKVSLRAYDIYTALDGRPAYSDELVARWVRVAK